MINDLGNVGIMTVKWKICKRCGKKVNEIADKCPYCKSSSFKDYIPPKVSNKVKIKPKSEIKWKVCNKCGKRINSAADKCPYCNSSFFITDKIIVHNGDSLNKIKYGLFYWKNDNGMFTFSKTKFISLLIILVCASDFSLNHYSIIAGIFIGLIFAFPVFFVGWIFHKSRESNDFINYNNTDKGLAWDIIHTFLYWGGDATSNFRLSKTKIISL